MSTDESEAGMIRTSTLRAFVLTTAIAGTSLVAATSLRLRYLQHKRMKSHNLSLQTGEPGGEHLRSVWVVMNPVKHADPAAFQSEVESAARKHGVDEIHWLETTREDPGTGQAIQAVRNGATLVIAAGGDGTVRAVAAGLAHLDVRMGIIPVGTGNIFARNLFLSYSNVEDAVATALGNSFRTVDVGWLRCHDTVRSLGLPAEGALVRAQYQDEKQTLSYLPRRDEYSYIVVSGLGYDGETMAQTDPKLKKSIGWAAYMVSGAQALSVPRLDAHIRLENTRHKPGASRKVEVRHANVRSILFANVSELLFLTLSPDAQMDDARFDVIAVDVRASVLGWLSVGWKFVAHSLQIPAKSFAISPGRVAVRQAHAASIRLDQPATVEADGDAIAVAYGVDVRIDPEAICVAAPRLKIR